MKNTLWNVADTIVKRIATAIKTDPKEAKSFLEEISKEYWFDYLEEELDKPPTLRPISEAKAGYDYLFLLQSRHSPDIYHWRVLYVMNEFRLYGQGGEDYDFNRANLEGNRVFKLIGWHPLLPIDKMQLPKTNEIKPC
jgi:hypothetical protein